MLLCGTLVSTLFHDVDDRLITGQCPRYDGVVLITGRLTSSVVTVLLVVLGTNGDILIIGFWRLIFGIWDLFFGLEFGY